MRGNHHDFDRWQELGNSGWSYKEVLPYFKKSENQQRGASEFHGVDGALSVTNLLAPAVMSEQFIEAAEQLGYGRNPDFNGAFTPRNTAPSLCQSGSNYIGRCIRFCQAVDALWNWFSGTSARLRYSSDC
ncbi:GMC family oxidoreductase N-terminal domain-containing protein [Nostoc sp. LEGE 12450]|uniref:GMC family oxidoreductase N-terminal domain-containing protein n=1 Tax=Nostoc sp. LEGE 12450 TaxID=1828643 RepID=UPI002AD1FF37|nr:GMC family oxidoreductase N-terminal domain-containing protein [Nostoc sp. LEGE 12450]